MASSIVDDSSKPYSMIKDIIFHADIQFDVIANELEKIKDIKDQKSVVDFLIREQLLNYLQLKDIEGVKNYLNLSIDLLRKELANTSLPFLLFSDVFNSLTIQKCEEFFSFMEECVHKFKDTPVFSSGRTMLLRICNDLLRRLSKSQDTVFCGRIQIFLSRLFPLDEKSGLNLMGHFNVDNMTPFNDLIDDADESDISEEISIDLTEESKRQSSPSLMELDNDTPLKSSKHFYKQFWTLQDFFRAPNQVYLGSDNFRTFSECTTAVLLLFGKIHFKDQPVKSLSTTTEQLDEKTSEWDCFTTADVTFTKYLTNEKLFDLQLMDVGFRRCFLLQLAITFQYLQLQPCKFKTAEQVLTNEQNIWLENARKDMQNLINEISSELEPFSKVVEQILLRESAKSQWKQDGCPSFVKRNKELKRPKLWTPNISKNRIPIKEDGKRDISFDTDSELGRLWRLTSDHWSACRLPERVHEVTLAEQFEPVQKEIKAGQCKKIQDERWSWSALRTLSRKSAYFYNNWTTPGQAMSAYLTAILQHDSLLNTTNKTEVNKANNPIVNNNSDDKPTEDESQETTNDSENNSENQTITSKEAMDVDEKEVESGDEEHVGAMEPEDVSDEGDDDEAGENTTVVPDTNNTMDD